MEKPVNGAPNKSGQAARLLTRTQKVLIRISVETSTILIESFLGFLFDADVNKAMLNSFHILPSSIIN
jgi:hypothetical protein